MADPTSFTQPNNPTNLTMPSPRTRSSTGGFFLKSLVCALLLFALPLFPSEAPAFISGTPLTNLWELLHLLFIGIAVSYGLFSRRNAGDRIQPQELPDSHSSRMQTFLSIFDDRCRENGKLQACDSGHSQVETFALNRKPKRKSFHSGDDVDIRSDYVETTTEFQRWNSQYLQCPPMIVVARPNYNLDADTSNRPLGLPVRSLRSTAAEPVGTRPRARGGPGSGAGSADSPISSGSGKNGNFGSLGPLNLEEKFDEAVSLPSPVPWRSRSGRMETERDLKPTTALRQPSHSRHLSVEESLIRHHRSSSFRSNASVTSHASSVSPSSPNRQSPVRSGTPDLLEVEMEEDFREKKRDPLSCVTAPLDDGVGVSFVMNSRTRINRDCLEKNMQENSRSSKEFGEDGTPDSSHVREYGKFRNGLEYSSHDERRDIPENTVQSHGSHLQNHVNGSFARRNGHVKCREGTQSFDRSSIREDKSISSYDESSARSSSNLAVKPPDGNTGAAVRGKSVRTFRANGKPMERIEQTCEGNNSRTVQHKQRHLGQSYPRKGEELGALNDEFVFSNKNSVERSPSVGRPKPLNRQNLGEEKFQDVESVESEEEEELDLPAESSFAARDDIDSFSNAGSDANEVDKKAGEFIAKFREQIMLQKTASIDASSVVDVTEDHYQ